MLESAWLFIGLVAILSTALAVLTNDDGIAIVAGVAGFITWGFFAFGSLNVQPPGEAAMSMPSVTILGVMMAMAPGYIALTGPVEIINRTQNPSADEI